MVNSTINIKAQNGDLVQNSRVYASSPVLSSGSMNITMHITDNSDNVTDATLNINPNSIRLLLYGTEEYSKQASLFFGNIFSGSFNSDIMWQLLGAATNEQINKTHLIDALSSIESDISDLADAFQIHYNNFNIHLTTEDRDFLTRLKALYGGVYNVALDYIVLKNPYEGEINITNQQIALFAGYGGFSAYSGALDIDLEFYKLVPGTYPTKSGGEPTPEAFFAQDNTYGYGITTLTVPTEEPDDLTDGEIAIYAGEGGFKSVSGGDADDGVIVGYYYNGVFYLDDQYEQIAEQNPDIIYVDLLENKIYRYDEDESEFVQLTTDAELIEGYYVKSEDKFYATFDGTTYSDEIEGKDKTIYLDLETNVLYRYDGTEETFIPVSSASGDSAIIKGYKNSVDGKFYTDISYTEEIVANAETLYYDILTSQIYYYIVSNQSFDRYHHKVSIDYLLFNDNYAGTISPAQNQNALFVGSGGFTSTSYDGNNEYFAGVGLILDTNTNTFAANLGFTSLNPSYHPVLADQQTGKLYVDVAGGSGVSDHNLLSHRFTTDFNGTVTPQHDIGVIDGLATILDKINRDTWSATLPIILSKTYSSGNYYNTFSLSTLDTVDTEESADTGSLLTINSSYYDDYTTTNSEHHRKIDKRWVRYSNTILADRIVKRNNDSSIAASYLLLTEGQSSVSPYSGVAAVFIGSGGFTSTSYEGSNDYYAGDGLWLDGDTFNVRLGFNTSGVNYAVQQDNSGNLFVTVPNSGGGGGGTTDHSALTHRFTTEFPVGSVVAQHDIGVISGLQDALDKAESWGVTWPLVKQDNQAPQTGEFYHNLSLTAITKTTTEDTTSTSGYLLTDATDYVEEAVSSVNTRAWNKNKKAYNAAISNSSLALRTATGGLAASYLLLTDSLSTAPTPASGEVAVFSGSGGFTATSYAGYSEYYDDNGITTLLSNYVFSVNLGYTTSGIRYAVKADSNGGGLYVEVPGGGGGGGGSSHDYYAGNGLSLDSSYYFSVVPKTNSGIGVDNNGVFLKTKSGGGLSIDSDGAYLNTSFVTTNNNYKTQIDSTTGGLYTNIPYANASTIGVLRLAAGTNISSITYSNGVATINASGGSGTTYEEGDYIQINTSRSTINVNVSALTGYTTSGKNYKVQSAANLGGLYVNVPWENTTYESKSASSGGTAVSLCTTGEKYTWNNKSDFSGNYNDLSNKPTIPIVNNATLTIQKNGTTVKTFTANASTDVTANISVPTKTSDLQNDIGFISSISLSDLPKSSTANTVLYTSTANSTPSWTNSPTLSSLTVNSTLTINGISLSKSSSKLSVGAGMSVSGDVSLSSGGKFYDSSDIRLKRNIRELVSVLDCIEDIPIVQFEYKTRENHKYIGTLAQKLIPLFPELLAQDSEGYYSVDYNGLAAIAIQGIKELYKEVINLKSKVYGN